MAESLPPIVFLHSGASWYLPYALSRARLSFPDVEVVLIGDADARSVVEDLPDLARLITLVDIQGVIPASAADFQASYRHLSTNPPGLVRFWCLRWLYMLEWAEQRNVSSMVQLDTDVLIYPAAQGRLLLPPAGTPPVGLSGLSSDWNQSIKWGAISGHVNRFTLEALRKFCAEYILQAFNAHFPFYFKRWQKEFEGTDRPGGLCDMAILHFFTRKNLELVENLAEIRNGVVCDHNMNVSNNVLENEYVMEQGMKKVVFREDGPALLPMATPHEPVSAALLHFQGAAKEKIPQFFKINAS